MALSILLAIIAVLVASVFAFFKHRFGYWARKNVPFVPPSIPFGNLKGVGTQCHIGEQLHALYKELKGKGPIGGLFFFTSPVIMPIDLEVIKNICIKDFNSFKGRGMYFNEQDDPLSAHLVALDGGPKWKKLRSKLTPTFTSGKMKFMFPTVVDVGAKLEASLNNLIEQNDVIEMKEMMAKFTTDVIGTCAFGIDCNSLSDPKAQFRAIGKKVFGEPRISGVVRFFTMIFPDMCRKLHIKVNHDDVSEFFMGIVRETIEIREKSNIRRNDFMDLLIEIKNNNTMDGTDVGNVTFEEIAAQAYVFFMAGFETSSTTMSYALFELSNNLTVQAKAREEIVRVLSKYDGQLTYEAMLEMPYLDCIINESMRKYPPFVILARVSNEPYHIERANVTIEKDTLVMVPVYAIHHDPEYYPDPEKFDPDRFTPEAMAARPHESFLPFGEGPRNCIGLRFGMMATRIGLINVLRKFVITPSSTSKPPPLEFDKNTLILTSSSDLPLKFERISPY